MPKNHSKYCEGVIIALIVEQWIMSLVARYYSDLMNMFFLLWFYTLSKNSPSLHNDLQFIKRFTKTLQGFII